MKLIIASNNKGKLAQLKSWLPEGIEAISMGEAGFTEIIPEPYDTFCLNALAKADTVWKWAKMPVLADDSGLCVEVLDDAPGVYSARYAGAGATDEENNQKLLDELQDVNNRGAYYFAQLCLIVDGSPYYFEGRCHGEIAQEPRGDGGFGYDPLFIPEGYFQTFAELSNEVKSRISHRASALDALREFFNSEDGAALLSKTA